MDFWVAMLGKRPGVQYFHGASAYSYAPGFSASGYLFAWTPAMMLKLSVPDAAS